MSGVGLVGMHGQSASVPETRLLQGAHEFEAQLMKELLRPMATGSSIGADESDAHSGDILGDFATEALGRALSARGGLGIATGVIRSLSGNENDSHFATGAEKNITDEQNRSLKAQVTCEDADKTR